MIDKHNMHTHQNQLIDLVVSRLTPHVDELSEAFENSRAEVGVRYCVIDDLLPSDIAQSIADAFPSLKSMRLMSSFREKKFTSKAFDQVDPIISNITFSIQDPKVIKLVERITNIENQIPDPSLYAGGLSAMSTGHHLGPHLDNSHDGSRTFYRTLNLLYYVTPDWKLENGGNLELWDPQVRRHITIESRFNRLAIMETTPVSWHSVSKVKSSGVRKCVSNYYFSTKSPTGKEYFNVTSFSARPEQPVLRLLAAADNGVRQTLRKLVPYGLGKKDVYQGPKV